MKKQDEFFIAEKNTNYFDKDVEEILFVALSKNKGMKRMIKRLSPFLLLVFFLVLWSPYKVITADETILYRWVLSVFFFVGLVNIWVIDFILWTYFEHKQVFKIWLIEIIFSFPIVYFLV